MERTGAPIEFSQKASEKESYEEETNQPEAPQKADQESYEPAKGPSRAADTQGEYYAASLLAAGYDTDYVKQELTRLNYSEEGIFEILNKAPYKMPHNHTRESHTPAKEMSFNEKLFMVFYAALVLFLIGWINVETNSPLFVIFVSFIPTLLTIVASILFFSTGELRHKIAVWTVPIFTSILWYALAVSGQFQPLNQVQAGNITFLNFVISIIYLIILDVFQSIDELLIRPLEKKLIKAEGGKKKKYSRESELEQSVLYHNTEKNIESYIQAIEDKAKALNFVIGRVYSNKHGGSAQLRELIRIPKEMYNLFSEVPPDQISQNISKLRQAVMAIDKQLQKMEESEEKIFGSKAHGFYNITHDPKERIIDVLIDNDKDPVATYYQSAREFCNKALTEIDAIAKKQEPDSNIISAHAKQNL
ncbi:MAG: hypothetical protein ACQESG_03075 [Nanobdellota archaeon]